VPHAVAILLILWRKQQTVACLVLRHKPRTRRGDFETQIIKPDGFETQTGKPSTTLILRLNQETHHRF
jgi:hypothetical protein